MSCCDGNAPAAAKCGSGACVDDKKTAETPVPAVAPQKPQGEGAGGGGCENRLQVWSQLQLQPLHL
ncbi:hypothetical protein Pint_35424 [Pistacia integerrima]|uniref:Uncharacterized protein n=1 Tax=Pistacia integerrima TaxID=434235 RepID=A0ACC0XYN9_9ROSI|nr:hypothetical protein Pint_35424 [Pistacia integerrima]